MSNHSFLSTCISASAGSGKTYQLVLRYIGLLALGVEPEKIIALTFTRKAAAEFSSRILTRLAEASASDEAADDLSKSLSHVFAGDGSQPGLVTQAELLDLKLNRSFYLCLLRKLVDRMGQLNMGTLDSFFSRLLGVLQFDLGMADISVASEEDLEIAKEEVFKGIYGSESLNDSDKSIFLELFKQATLGKDSDDLDRNLRGFVKEYHSIYLSAREPALWANEGRIWAEVPWWEDAMSGEQVSGVTRQMTEDHLYLCLNRIDGKAVHKSLFKQVLNFKDDLLAATLKSWPKFSLGKDFFPQLRSGEVVFNAYKNDYKLDGIWASGLLELSKIYVKTHIKNALERTKGIYQLIHLFESIYDIRVRRHGKLAFSDITRCLVPENNGSPGMPDGGLMDLAYRLDGWFDHWMLDEFQDTSNEQWDILRGYLDEVIQDTDGKRSVFVVGDSKQSIYQWRGGSPRIFESVRNPETVWGKVLYPWSMDVSYRSAQPVLELVNAICDFRKTADMANGKALSRWRFESHRPMGKAASLDGYAEVRMLSPGRDDDCSGTPEQREITEILKEIKPFEKGLTCAILVKGNKDALEMKEWLSSREGGEISSLVENDVKVGLDSGIGKTLFDFFVWLMSPGDRFAWEHLLASPFGNWLSREEVAGQWIYWRGILETGGFEATLKAWESRLRAKVPHLLNPYQENRLSAWRQEAVKADNEGKNLSEWIDYVREMKRREHSKPESVQIMTFHKAKGLEFDVVLLPLCKIGKFDNASHFKLVKQENQWGEVENIMISPGMDIIAKDPQLSVLKDAWEETEQFEGFCKLYVALTRARRACYVVAEYKDYKDEIPCSPSAIIQRACDLQGMPYSEEQSCGLSYGNKNWHRDIPLAGAGTCLDKEKGQKIPCLPQAKPRARQTPAGNGERRDDFSGINFKSVSLGNEIHALFQQVDWWTEEKINVQTKGVSEEAVRLFEHALNSLDFVKWLSKPEGHHVSLWKERAVSGKLNGIFIRGVVDRVQLVDGLLTIIDFKTDDVDDPEVLRQRYSGQLECYRELMARALDIPIEQTRCVLLAVRNGQAIVI